MAVPHPEIVAFHESGHLVIGYRTGVAVPYEIYLETEHGQLDGHLGANEDHGIPSAAEAIVRTTYAGPLAEMKRLAIDQFGEGAVFDLTDDGEGLLSVIGDKGLIRLRFAREGVSHVLQVAAAPFGTDIGRIANIISAGHLTERKFARSYGTCEKNWTIHASGRKCRRRSSCFYPLLSGW
ncbi:MAG: hypothetical protein QM775_30915 [Pirellulales bacterium]